MIFDKILIITYTKSIEKILKNKFKIIYKRNKNSGMF